MKGKRVLYIFLVSLLILLLFSGICSYLNTYPDSKQADVFVGVDAAYDNIARVKSRVDEVKSYTNFFVIGSTGITLNATKLNDVCQYLNDSGLHFATFTHTTNNADSTIQFNQSEWTNYAKQRWNNHFLGLYTYDEPGGHQIDHDDPYMVAPKADNYSDAANKYVGKLSDVLSEFKSLNSPLMTSDYTLYEFDYRAGYDLVLAQYAWNHSRPLNTALCRGAATMHGKDWGVMITYTYDTPPYLASGPEIYNDMVTAYQNGAKYIVLFDYAKDLATMTAHGILQQEHLDALKQFWQYIKDHPRPSNEVDDRVAYVLPENYGYGFRGPNDALWGLWGADNLSNKIWSDVTTFAEQYKPRLDIIYEDSLRYSPWNYSKLIFWNGTVLTKNS
jgi:hypothetical protein